MSYVQNNEVARGYLLKAVNTMIQDKTITEEQGQSIMLNFSFSCDCMTEKQALEYSRSQRLGDSKNLL